MLIIIFTSFRTLNSDLSKFFLSGITISRRGQPNLVSGDISKFERANFLSDSFDITLTTPRAGVNYKELHLGPISQVSISFGKFFKNLPVMERGI
jgi:hypothetical protein